MDPSLVHLDPEAKGFHKFIAFETGVLPVRCYFVGQGDRAEDKTLHVVVTERELREEPLRVPSPDHPSIREVEERYGFQFDIPPQGTWYENAKEASYDEKIAAHLVFPKRRHYDLSKEDFEKELDAILTVPFEVEVVNEETLLDG